ncbi:hypothetical protein DYQ93_07450 [Xanthomonas sp. LMG 8992]|nr:hypothetical protein [Xanthomonas sp. LMG 8992]
MSLPLLIDNTRQDVLPCNPDQILFAIQELADSGRVLPYLRQIARAIIFKKNLTIRTGDLANPAIHVLKIQCPPRRRRQPNDSTIVITLHHEWGLAHQAELGDPAIVVELVLKISGCIDTAIVIVGHSIRWASLQAKALAVVYK